MPDEPIEAGTILNTNSGIIGQESLRKNPQLQAGDNITVGLASTTDDTSALFAYFTIGSDGLSEEYWTMWDGTQSKSPCEADLD